VPLADLASASTPIRFSGGRSGDIQWTAQLHIPKDLPLPLSAAESRGESSNRHDQIETGWDYLEKDTRASVVPVQPPLSILLPSFTRSTPKALSATHVAKLGQAMDHADSEQRGKLVNQLRAELFHAAPAELPELPNNRQDVDKKHHRIIGEVVHQALQFDLLNTIQSENLLSMLEVYAWQFGVTNPDEAETIAGNARALLDKVGSHISDLMADARQIYHELPFTFQLGARTITGKIDVLFFDGIRWTILDYKTDDLPATAIYGRARRYYGQLGVYAAAVEQITGQPPRTVLYFIRPGQSVTVKQDQWRAALDRLTADLDMLADGNVTDQPS